MKQLIECVPNFSEGVDMDVIRRITEQIESVEGVKLLDVDPGKATNRTVVTFVGPPEQVVEAAFQAVKLASEIIDMSRHSGEHPRFGATDVCPFVPVSGISMEETVKYAHQLAERIGSEIGIPVYCYENAGSWLIPYGNLILDGPSSSPGQEPSLWEPGISWWPTILTSIPLQPGVPMQLLLMLESGGGPNGREIPLRERL